MSGFERGPGRSLAGVDQAIEAAFADQRLVGAVVLVAHRGSGSIDGCRPGRPRGRPDNGRGQPVPPGLGEQADRRVAALSLVDEGPAGPR